MNYERLTQHLTGPLAALIGTGATVLVHSTVSHAVALNVAAFVTSGLATYLGHAKWMDNLTHWWVANTIANDPELAAPVIAPGAGFKFGDPTSSPPIPGNAEHLREQLRSHGIEPKV